MKLTEEQVKEIIKKVHIDLNLDHSSKYPVLCGYTKKGHKTNDFDFNMWSGGFDYRDPEAVGDEWMGLYTEYYIIVDDDKKEAVQYGIYSGHFEIRLNEKENYVIVNQLNRP